MSDLEGEDWRSDDARKMDLMIDQVADLAKSVRELTEKVPAAGGTTQRLVYRHEGMGPIGIVCAVVSVCCVLMMLGCGWLISIEFGRQNAELHDLRAWRDIHQNHISAIEAREEKRK